jgi:hypothetical protein
MERPSLILPKKRLRLCPEKMKPGINVMVTGLNVVKKMTAQETEKVLEFMKNYPGEFFKVEYWKLALERGLQLDLSPEALRLFWMNLQTRPLIRTEFSLKVRTDFEYRPASPQAPSEELLIIQGDAGRRVFSVKEAENQFKLRGFINKFENLLKTCNKITKKPLTEQELAVLLFKFKGSSKDLLFSLIDQSCKTPSKILYNDCSNLCKRQIPLEVFISVYLDCKGMITSIYSHFASAN